MRLTIGFQQSITMMGLIATQKGENGLNIKTIASQMKIKESYLRKLARKLVTYGLLHSSKNKYSGYTLTKSPSEISLLDIFNAIEGEETFLTFSDVIEKTFHGIEEDYVAKKMGEVVELLGDAEKIYRQKLSGYSLENLLRDEKKQLVHTMDWNAMNSIGNREEE